MSKIRLCVLAAVAIATLSSIHLNSESDLGAKFKKVLFRLTDHGASKTEARGGRLILL